MNQRLTNQDREAIIYGAALHVGMSAAEARWIAVECADGAERWVRADNLPAQAHHSAATTRETTNRPTGTQTALIVALCVLGALLTAAVGLRLLFWGWPWA